MGWPNPQDYNEAIQNPHLNFADEELRQGKVQLTVLGLPRVASGNFASVYRMRCASRDVAVRCFLHNFSDQQARYQQISRYIMSDDLPATVPFEFVPKGIRIRGQWYPILKMEWVDGWTLDAFVKSNLSSRHVLARLSEISRRWQPICEEGASRMAICNTATLLF